MNNIDISEDAKLRIVLRRRDSNSADPKPRSRLKTIVVFGGHGRTAQALTRLLVKRSYKVYSIIRNSSQVDDIHKLGAHPIVQDLEKATVEKLTKIINATKAEIIVWAASGTFGDPSAPERIDHQAAVRMYDAAAKSELSKRVLVISALDVRDRSKPIPSWYSEEEISRSKKLWEVLKPYMKAKLAADRDLVSNEKRDLKWTIIRPAGLLDSDGAGTVEAGRVHWTQNISRSDVAAVLAACIEDDRSIGLAFDVVGGKTDIKTAVAKVGERRDDCFRGYY